MGGFLKYATEMGSGAMIYVHTWFYGHRFRHSKVYGAGEIYRQQSGLIRLLFFFKIKKSV
jgi:hypothetical protein